MNLKKTQTVSFYDVFFIYFVVTYPVAYINIILFSNILPNNQMILYENVFHKMIIEDSIFFLFLFLSMYMVKSYYLFDITKLHLKKFLSNINQHLIFFLILFSLFYLLSNQNIDANLVRVFNYSELICLSIFLALLYIKFKSNYFQLFFIFIISIIYLLISINVPSGKGYIKDLIVIFLVINILSNNKFYLFFRNNLFKLLLILISLYLLITGLEVFIKSNEYNYCYSNCLYGYDVNEFFTPIGASEIMNTIRIYSLKQISNINYPIFLSIIENIIPNSLYNKFDLNTPTLLFEKFYNNTTSFTVDDSRYEYYAGLGLGIVNFFRLFFMNTFDLIGVYILMITLLCFISYFSTKYIILYLTFYPLFLIAIHRLIRTDPAHFINTILFLFLGSLIVSSIFLIYKKFIKYF
ncbi:hypothetical protein OAS25_02885 [Alphaproteobacteria bacterium]|nr:hypothetical protein [Alphaproteobacteria bacterium]